jgi:hypothetical protein
VTADVAGFAAAARSRALAVYAVIAQLRDERRVASKTGCQHEPTCPAADAVDHDAARFVRRDEHIGASLLCNGIWIFGDTGELIPDDNSPGGCHIEAPHRGPAPHNHPEGEQS